MHHRQHRPLESRHRALKLRAAGNVQVIDRLIEQQKVAARRRHPRQGQPRAFAVTERSHRREDFVAGEEIVVQERAHIRI